MIIPLSYPLTAKTPLYPNTPVPVIHSLRSIERGDSANTSAITFSTHSGTHIDVPRHFCRLGKTVSDCLTQDSTFFPTYCIDIQKTGSEEITSHDLEDWINRVQDAEAILIRTGWHTLRSENPEKYKTDHPWVSPEIPQLLKENCPKMNVFGLDQISISSTLHREAGHECHRKFLCGKKPILLLEDLNLSDNRLKNPFRIHVYPYFIDKIDGIPATVIAEI